MKKIVIEIDDEIYDELLKMKAKLNKKNYDAPVEAIAADLLSETIRLEAKFKNARDNFGGLFDGMNGLSPEDLMENLKSMLNPEASSNETKKENEKAEYDKEEDKPSNTKDLFRKS